LAILAALAGEIGVSYNGSGRYSTELQACFYGAATTMAPTTHESVMGRLMGANTNPSRFSDETSQQNINLMNNVLNGLSTPSQQWLFVALTHGEGLSRFHGNIEWTPSALCVGCNQLQADSLWHLTLCTHSALQTSFMTAYLVYSFSLISTPF
jgi:hypothetical protein